MCVVVIRVHCICGNVFTTTIEPETIDPSFRKAGLLPILLSHEDHLVTVYLDPNYAVRSVERVILVEDSKPTELVTSAIDVEALEKTVRDTWAQNPPMKDYGRFMAVLIYQLKNAEALFAAGEMVGRRMWREWRADILKMGAQYVPAIDLIIKTELRPLLDRMGKTRLISQNELEINEVISPHFIVGIAQGVLNAVAESASVTINVKIKYTLGINSVHLSIAAE